MRQATRSPLLKPLPDGALTMTPAPSRPGGRGGGTGAGQSQTRRQRLWGVGVCAGGTGDVGQLGGVKARSEVGVDIVNTGIL